MATTEETKKAQPNPMFEMQSKLVYLKNQYNLGLNALASDITEKIHTAPDDFTKRELQNLFDQVMKQSNKEHLEIQFLNSQPLYKMHAV